MFYLLATRQFPGNFHSNALSLLQEILQISRFFQMLREVLAPCCGSIKNQEFVYSKRMGLEAWKFTQVLYIEYKQCPYDAFEPWNEDHSTLASDKTYYYWSILLFELTFAGDLGGKVIVVSHNSHWAYCWEKLFGQRRCVQKSVTVIFYAWAAVMFARSFSRFGAHGRWSFVVLIRPHVPRLLRLDERCFESWKSFRQPAWGEFRQYKAALCAKSLGNQFKSSQSRDPAITNNSDAPPNLWRNIPLLIHRTTRWSGFIAFILKTSIGSYVPCYRHITSPTRATFLAISCIEPQGAPKRAS